MSLTTSFRLSIGCIVLALLGLVVVLARAEPRISEDRSLHIYCTPPEACPASGEPDLSDAASPCLAQMEAAMRAMEPYLNVYDEQTDITIHSPFKGAPTSVMQQWADVRRACWQP